MSKQNSSNGTLLCARYAFAPNYYHYCGPDTRGDFGAYVAEETADDGLTSYIEKFEMLYPYLTAIAHANGIADPLDERVVEAYWVGNNLLAKVSPQDMLRSFTDYLHLDKSMAAKQYKWLLPKIDQGVRLHHSFNVFDVFLKKTAQKVQVVVESMDQCRIGWGRVVEIPKFQMTNDKLGLKSQRLVYEEGKLKLVPEMREVVMMDETLRARIRSGDWVSYHWGFVCDVLSTAQVKRLQYYTEHNLEIANKTL